MMAKDYIVVVLAASQRTRMKSELPHALHPAGGRPLIEHVIRACKRLRAMKVIVIVGKDLARRAHAIVGSRGAICIVKEPPRGTGHAMLAARKAVGKAKYALVVPADVPLVRAETLSALIATHREGKAAATILSIVLADPSGCQRIIRRSETGISAIVEESRLKAEEREINEVNSGIYCLTLGKLWRSLAELEPDSDWGELYVTDVINLLCQKGERVLATVAPDPTEALGCSTRQYLAEIDRIFRARKCDQLMMDGVTVQFPETVIVDPDVVVGSDTMIEANVQLLGKTRIGLNCVVRAGSIIKDSVIGNGITVPPQTILEPGKLRRKVSQPGNGKYKFGAALSFAGEDRKFVERVAVNLELRGVRVFYDVFERHKMLGKNLVEYLAEMYSKKANYCVMFISRHYVRKAWPRHERRHAFDRQLEQTREYILPVRLDGSQVPGLPRATACLDGRRELPESVAEVLAEKIKSA